MQYQMDSPNKIRVVSGVENVGARKNSFRCERLCRGTYIAYCEGDDYWHDTQKLNTQVQHLEANPACGLVYTNADTYEVTSGRRTKNALPRRSELCDCNDPFLAQLTGATIIWPLTVCLKKTLLDEVVNTCPEPTDEQYPMGDTPRFLEIARRSTFFYMPISTATRNLLPESATRSKNLDRRAKFVEGSKKLTLHYLDKYSVPERYDRKVRTWVYQRELEYAFRCGDAQRGLRAASALKQKRLSVPVRHMMYFHGSQGVVRRSLIQTYFAVCSGLTKFRNWISNRRHSERRLLSRPS